jgi:membrane protein
MTVETTRAQHATLRDDLTRLPAGELLTAVRKRFAAEKIGVLSAAFAYHWVFAIPPLLILMVMVGALLNRVTDIQVVEELRQVINDRAPADSRDLLNRLVDNAVAEVSGGLASIGVIITGLIALWSASNAVNILVTGFNLIYNVNEDRPFVKQKLRVIGLTLVLVFFVNLAIALLIFGQGLGEWIAEWFGLGGAFEVFWGIARWPIAISGIAILLAILYWAGPNVKQPFRWISVGSVAATLMWLILIGGFGLYLSIANPGSAWGIVGSVIVLLFFLNLTGTIFYLGAVINAVLLEAVEGRPVEFAAGPGMAVANQ